MTQATPEISVMEDLNSDSEHGAITSRDKPLAPSDHEVEINTTNSAAPNRSTPYSSQVNLDMDAFKILAKIGKGNSANIMLAESKHSMKLYAIKVLKKELLIANDEINIAMREKRILEVTTEEKHPFIIRLFGTFQSETKLCFVMDYIPAGDLMWQLQRRPFTQEQAQFYAAEVCLVLKYLHTKEILYRDMKLDNILLAIDGHIKVIDFGTSAEKIRYGTTTNTFCGNAEFMAPEILRDEGYGFAVDWWSLGVLIYQMSFQTQPFRGEDEDEIYDAILGEEPLYPSDAPQSTVEICQELLAKKSEQRLGAGPTDAQELMVHPYFNGVNWDDLYHKRVLAPYIPTMASEMDTSDLDTEVAGIITARPQSALSNAMQENFKGFSGSFQNILDNSVM